MNFRQLISFSPIITRIVSASLAIAAGIILSSLSPAGALTLSDPVYWDAIGRDLRIANPRLTSIDSGNINNSAADLTINSEQKLAFDWTFGADTSNSSNCPLCIIQNYIAWIQPSQTVNSSLGFVSGIFNGNSSSGSFSWTTTAPSTPGTYYTGSNLSLQYNFLDNIPGQPGGPTSSGPYSKVAAFKVVVNPVPGPFPLFGMASALAASLCV